MPGGGKGPSQSGSVTQTTTNPTQMAQLPFLTGAAADNAGFANPAPAGFNAALNLNQTDPFQYYPNQTLADFNPAIGGGYQDLVNQYGTTRNIASAGNGVFNGIAGGDMLGASSPAFGAFTDLRNSGTNAQQDLTRLASYLRSTADTAQPLTTGNQADQLDLANLRGVFNGLSVDALRNPFIGELQSYATGPIGADSDISRLSGMAGGPINGVGTGYGLLSGAGRAALGPNVATDLLTRTARGDYLNSNPYLQAAISAATRPLVRDYQTAVAPTNDSTAEAAGRYGSGFHQNIISDSEQNLAKAVGDTTGAMSSANYENERGLQNQAQSTLGSLINQGLGLGINAGEGIGNLGLGEFGARAGALENAGSLGLQDYLDRAGILENAGSQYSTGVGQAIGAREAAAQTDQARINSILGGINAENNAYTTAGQLDAANLGGIEAGANGLQSGFDTGNRNTIIGLGMEPTILGSNYTPGSEMTTGGQGLTSLEQQRINDAENRFYGNQQAPWQQAAAYMNLIGNPVGGSSSTNSPILGPSPFSSALGTLGSIGSLGNQFGLFGSGGLLGGGAGAGSMFGALSGLGSAGATAGLFGSAAGEAAPFLAGGGADALSSFLPLLAF